MKTETRERRRPARSSPYEAAGIGHALQEMALELSHRKAPEDPEDGLEGPQQAQKHRVDLLVQRPPDERRAPRERTAKRVEAQL